MGVSQGAALLFALLSKKPSYNAVIAKATSYGGYRSSCYNEQIGYALIGRPYGIFGVSSDYNFLALADCMVPFE